MSKEGKMIRILKRAGIGMPENGNASIKFTVDLYFIIQKYKNNWNTHIYRHDE